MSEATIKIKTEGAAEAKRAADEVRGAWGKAATEIQGGFATVAKSVAGAVTQTVTDLAKVAFAVEGLNFIGAIRDTKEFQLSVSRMALGAGKSLDELDKKFRAIGGKGFIDPQRVATFVGGLTKTTYNMDAAANAASVLSAESVRAGRSLEEFGELGALLAQTTKGIEGAEQALAKLRGTAKGTGLDMKAALDFVGGERKTLQKFADPQKVGRQATAMIGQAVARGYTEEQAKEGVGKMVGDIAADPRGWGYMLGLGKDDMHDAMGRLIQDPVELMRRAQKRLRKRYGAKRARFVAGNLLNDPMAGAMLMGMDMDAVQAGAVAPAVAPPAPPAITYDAQHKLETQQKLKEARDKAARDAMPMIDRVEAWTAEQAEKYGLMPTAIAAGTVINAGVSLLPKALPWFGGALKGIASGAGTVLAPAAQFGAATGAAALTAAGAVGYGVGTVLDQGVGWATGTTLSERAAMAVPFGADVGAPIPPGMLEAIRNQAQNGGTIPVEEIGDAVGKSVADAMASGAMFTVEVRNYSDSPVEATTKNKGKGAPQ